MKAHRPKRKRRRRLQRVDAGNKEFVASPIPPFDEHTAKRLHEQAVMPPFDEHAAKRLNETAEKLTKIFLPYAAQSRERMAREKGRFVQYTSARNALSIIQTKRLWMRHPACMSDYAEVWHGLQAIKRCYADKPSRRQAFKAALNDCHKDADEEIRTYFDAWGYETHLQTYVTCLSEHDDKEDRHGRLSMWRAFGGDSTARVALVIKLDLTPIKNAALNVILNPVAYFSDQELENELDAVISNVQAERDFLCTLPRPLFTMAVWQMLTARTVCLKHEGFREEREWRITYSPRPFGSPFIESATEVISGIPQVIYKIPLENISSAGIELGFADVFDRLIIGPTQFPFVMVEAFAAALDAAGVKDAPKRVFVSEIPVRT